MKLGGIFAMQYDRTALKREILELRLLLTFSYPESRAGVDNMEFL
jgi:hypothetical protein